MTKCVVHRRPGGRSVLWAIRLASLLAALCLLPGAVEGQTLLFDECVAPDDEIGGDVETSTSSFDVSDDLTVDDVRVSVDIAHPWVGDLVVELESPSDTQVTLHNKDGAFADESRP